MMTDDDEVSQLILSPIVANADTSSSTLCCNRSFLCEGEKVVQLTVF